MRVVCCKRVLFHSPLFGLPRPMQSFRIPSFFVWHLFLTLICIFEHLLNFRTYWEGMANQGCVRRVQRLAPLGTMDSLGSGGDKLRSVFSAFFFDFVFQKILGNKIHWQVGGIWGTFGEHLDLYLAKKRANCFRKISYLVYFHKKNRSLNGDIFSCCIFWFRTKKPISLTTFWTN